MNKVVDKLLYVDSHDSVMRLLQSWRLWVVGALVGALIGAGVFAVFPSPYRARAVVVVDHNIEDVYDIPTERQFYFMGRETRKLQNLAWSDETLQIVADQVGDVRVRELREEILSLSQPGDGGWYFYADDKDAARAEEIAGVWAEAFYHQVLDGVEVSEYLMVIRTEVEKIFDENRDYAGGEARDIAERLNPHLEESKGVSIYVEVILSQTKDLQIERAVPLYVYILAGSVIGASGLALAALMMLRAEENDDFLVN